MRNIRVLGVVVAVLLCAAAASWAAKPAARLDVDDLLAAARTAGGEVYEVRPARRRAPKAPKRMMAYRAAAPGDFVTFRVPVPRDGYYRVFTDLLSGPWKAGRHGVFRMWAGDVKMGEFHGWYGTPPDPPYRMRNQRWGAAHFSAPEAEVRLELSRASGGKLVLLEDLRLVPVGEDQLTPRQRELRVSAAPSADGEEVGGLLEFSLTRQRDLKWTTFVPRMDGEVTVDGSLADWDGFTGEVIAIDGSFVPERGWATPPPAGDEDLSAEVMLAWDSRHLYVAARVRDDDLKSPPKDRWGSPYGLDSLVVHVRPSPWLTGGGRGVGPVGAHLSFGLSYYPPALSPRPLGGDARYVARRQEGGYTLEAALPFSGLGWRPGRAGDRFPLGLILVDRDPGKPSGQRFDQYGWNFGPGSRAGTGEVRLVDGQPAAGELIPANRTVAPGGVLRYVGSIDAAGKATLAAVEVCEGEDGRVLAALEVGRTLDRPGRYSLVGSFPLPDLEPEEYELRLRWAQSGP